MKNKKDIKDLDKETNILMDESVLKDMFEGKNKDNRAEELMFMMKKVNDGGGKLDVKVPMSHFLRAIFLSEPNTPIKNIQKVLSFTEVIPSFADFKDKKACMDEIIMIAKAIRGEKKNEN